MPEGKRQRTQGRRGRLTPAAGPLFGAAGLRCIIQHAEKRKKKVYKVTAFGPSFLFWISRKTGIGDFFW